MAMMLQRPFGVPLGFVARREAVEEVGGYEDEFRGMYDDQVFLAKFALRHRVWVTSACTYRYRRHPGSIVWVSNSAGEKQRNRKRFLDWLEAGRHNSTSTRNQRLAAISSFYRWMQSQDPTRMACCQDILAIPVKRAPQPAVNHLTVEQTRRLLADPRSEALATRFASQWLRLQDLDKIHPDANLFPDFNQQLADAMLEEYMARWEPVAA
mgnify:CR=1 FL=1